MSSTPRVIGTLIVVVLKANHLPNKRHIGKQDPYCLVSVNGEKRRTKAIKRGGQHPEWDEEIRFTLYEDVEDVLHRTAHGNSTPPPPPPKDDKIIKTIKGGKTMKLACYADDPREPDLIGEADVDLTEVLTKGETDEWFTLTSKDKFAGKVYLELTFWSNEAPPEKKAAAKTKGNKQYGGPGSFIPTSEHPNPSILNSHHPSRVASTGSVNDYSRPGLDTIPPSLRASSSLATLDLYVPPYEQQRQYRSPIDQLTNEFGEFGVATSHRRRESFPAGFSASASSMGITMPIQNQYYDHSPSETGPIYGYDQPAHPPPHPPPHQRTLSNAHVGYGPQPPYQQYEQAPFQTPIRGPRQSVPTSSSGFTPLPNHNGYATLSSHPSDPSGFVPPPLSHTPAAHGYNPPQSVFGAPLSQAPMSPNNGYLSPSTSTPFQQPFSSPQQFAYPSYPPTVPTPAPLQFPAQQFQASQPPLSAAPSNNSPSQMYAYSTASSPSHDHVSPPLPQHSSSSNINGSSRPLPLQPQVVYGQPGTQAPPPSQSGNLQTMIYSPPQAGNAVFPATNGYPPALPPPPPPPPAQYTQGQQSFSADGTHVLPGPPPPPPPPAPQKITGRRQSSLPIPPVNYLQQQHQHPSHPLPPPPPPPVDFYSTSQPLPLPPPPPPGSQLYHPGPPPKPPTQVEDQTHWSSSNVQQVQNHYPPQGYTLQ